MTSVEHPRQPPITMVNLTVRDLSSPVHLPHPLTPFVGRVAEVAAVVARLRDPGAHVRLLNFTGPGGIGKTRLAIAVAGELVEDYPDGIHYVRLVAITDPTHVPLAVAQSLDLRETGRDLPSRIADAIGQQRLLVVLDNFEQVVDAAPFVSSLLGACPNLTIITTSRVRLQVAGENEYPVRPLHLPRLDETSSSTVDELASADAVALFLDRARSAAAVLDGDDIRVVSEICDHLEGIPLGIELAAARLRVLSPQLVLDRLRHQLEFLTGGELDRPAHQRTMRDTVAWSYDLLSPVEQAAFRVLSIFTGGFTIEAAAAILGSTDAVTDDVPIDVLDLIASLLDKGLLRKREEPGQSEPRLSMLVAVGEYGHEQLHTTGEYASAHDRHAQWALAFAEASARKLAGPDASRWLRGLDAEQGNIRQAFGWLDASGDRNRFVRLALALEDYWLTRARYSEALQWLGRAMELSVDAGDVPDARLRCTLAAAWIALRGGDGIRATALADTGLALARGNPDVRLVVRSLNVAAGVARRADDHQRAFDLIEESRRRSEEAGDRRAVADALRESAYALMNLGRLDEAIDACRASIAYFEEIGNAQSAAMARDNMSLVYYLRGDYAEAHRYSQEAIEVFRRLGYTRGVGIALCHLGLSATHLGKVEAAWNFHMEELAHRTRVGDARGYAVWLEAVALLLAVCGDGTGATTIIGAADGARERAHAPLARTERGDRDHTLGLVRHHLTDDAIEAALRQGKSLAIPAAIEQACALVPPAIASYRKPAPFSAFGLSTREEEILQLVARRLTDREIAESLFISRHTVARHVASILRKMNVRSRHDAARIANER